MPVKTKWGGGERQLSSAGLSPTKVQQGRQRGCGRCSRGATPLNEPLLPPAWEAPAQPSLPGSGFLLLFLCTSWNREIETKEGTCSSRVSRHKLFPPLSSGTGGRTPSAAAATPAPSLHQPPHRQSSVRQLRPISPPHFFCYQPRPKLYLILFLLTFSRFGCCTAASHLSPSNRTSPAANEGAELT